MPCSVFCPLESRELLEAAAATLVEHLRIRREDAFARLLRSFGIVCEAVDEATAAAVAAALQARGANPVVKDDGEVLRPPRAESCLGFQVRATLFRVFRRGEFEDIPRSSLLLISSGKVVVRRAATAPRKQAGELRTIYHAGAGAKGASPDSSPQGAAVEQQMRQFLDLYMAPGGTLRHFRADRDQINFNACLDRPAKSLVENFSLLLDELHRSFGNAFSATDRAFHGVPDFDRYNKFLLNYPPGTPK